MTQEEMERTMQFIIEQQSHFAGSLDRLVARMDQLAERQDHFQMELGQLKDVQAKAQAQMDKLTAATLGLVSIVGNLTDKIETLTEQGQATTEKLDHFITVVERYISAGRNGKPE